MKIDARVTLALVLAIILQGAAGFVWTGRTAERLDELERRIDAHEPVAERLARLETRADEAKEALDRIERRLETRRR